MKVCVITSIFHPYTRGGAEAVAYASAKIFDDVFVITASSFKDFSSFAGQWEIVDDKIRVFRFTPFNLFSIFSISKYPKLLRLIWHVLDIFNPHTYLVVSKILEKEKPDLVLTHNLKGLGYTIPIAIKRLKIKWIHTIHDLGLLHPSGLRIFGSENSLLQKNILVFLYEWINRKMFGSPDVLISPSRFLLEEYNKKDFFPQSEKVILRNPVAWIENEKNNKKEVFRFLYAGQLEPYKGINVLLKAWREFSGQHPKIELIIAGSGSLTQTVKESNLARIKFVGWVQLNELLPQVNVAILPSLAYENSPTIIGESFSCGVPMIASRIGGIPELIQDGVNGILTEPGNVDDLIKAMENSLNSDMGAAAKESSKDFSLEEYKKGLCAYIGE